MRQIKTREKVGLGLFGVALTCCATAAVLTTFVPRNYCVELPMPRSEVAALALVAAAGAVWLIGVFVGSVSSLRLLGAGVATVGLATYPMILVFGAIPHGGCG